MTRPTIRFHLDELHPQDGGTFEYRPWGTRTLKLHVTSDLDLPPLWITCDHRERQPGLVQGYADDSTTLSVTWGGGHELGAPAMVTDLVAVEQATPVAAGQTNYVYLNIRHVGPQNPERAHLTLKAITAENSVKAILHLQLSKPGQFPTAPLRFIGSEQPQQWSMGAGDQVAVYDSRWWPRSRVEYQPLPAHWPPAPLKVQRERNELRYYWQDQQQPAAIVTDQTRPSIFEKPGAIALEPFLFGDARRQYLVVRTWFFWLDTTVSYSPFGMLGRHEVPDAERFDFLFHVGSGRVMLACTDLHWRETWGQTIAAPLEATLGLNYRQKLALARQKLWPSAQEFDERIGYNPLGYIERLAERLGHDDTDLVQRARGTQAHVPTLNKVVQVAGNELNTVTPGMRTVHDMTSSDVRRG